MIDEASKRRIKQLCEEIATEQDRGNFSHLVAELNQLLEELDTKPKKPDPQSVPE